MTYPEVDLFLGFQIDLPYSKVLSKLDPAVYSLFVRNDDTYLHEIEHEGKKYLGKPLGNLAELSTVELLQLNILSLLKRLNESYPYDKNSLVILTLYKHS